MTILDAKHARLGLTPGLTLTLNPAMRAVSPNLVKRGTGHGRPHGARNGPSPSAHINPSINQSRSSKRHTQAHSV